MDKVVKDHTINTSCLCLADIHGILPDLSNIDFDALFIAGDIVPLSIQRSMKASAYWLDTTFRKWLEKINKPIVGIAGNHCFIFQNSSHLIPKDLPWIYLQDSGTKIDINGNVFNIWGSPWQPIFYNWAFNLTESELRQKWNMIPHDTDILLTHGPPRFYGDLTENGQHVGSYTLTERLDQLNIRLHCFGHIHDAVGVYNFKNTTLVNCSYLNEEYEPNGKSPILVKL